MVEGKLRLLSQTSAAFRTAINGVISKLTTATYTVQEATDEEIGGPGIAIAASSGNTAGTLSVSPHGSSGQANIEVYSAADNANASVGIMQAQDADAIYLLSDKQGSASVLPIKLQAGTKVLELAPSGALTLPGALILHSADVFLSAEITGDGSAQATAHSLGRTPVIAIAYITATAGSDTVSAVTSDGTNCTVTAHTGTKYRILAF